MDDLQSLGLLLIAVVAAPYILEIVRQVPLLTRLLDALPAEQRARLGRHPRDARLGMFGSTLFFLRLGRITLRTDPNDSAELTALKRAVRRSIVRELIFGGLLLAAVLLLWRQGWRPPWPTSSPASGPTS